MWRQDTRSAGGGKREGVARRSRRGQVVIAGMGCIGVFVDARATRGGGMAATQGFDAESRWDSKCGAWAVKLPDFGVDPCRLTEAEFNGKARFSSVAVAH